MIQDFTKQLEQKRQAIRDEIDSTWVEMARDHKWWESVNIFAHGMDCRNMEPSTVA
jgi:hypothetical protein